MAELESLPDLEIKELEVKEPVVVHEIPDIDEPIPVEEPQVSYPKMIMIKKQLKPLPWHMHEQDFLVHKHAINPSDMDAFDKFIEEHIPKDPNVRNGVLRFIEDVLLKKTSEHESRVFYNDGKNLSFKISFLM